MKDGVVGCSHRRGARQVATQQLGLAEVAAGPELVDVPAAARHFGVHRCDDVERLARFAFLEDGGPRGEDDPLQARGQILDRRLRQRAPECNLVQQLDVGVAPGMRRSSARRAGHAVATAAGPTTPSARRAPRLPSSAITGEVTAAPNATPTVQSASRVANVRAITASGARRAGSV
jgi:hypothetical protein